MVFFLTVYRGSRLKLSCYCSSPGIPALHGLCNSSTQRSSVSKRHLLLVGIHLADGNTPFKEHCFVKIEDAAPMWQQLNVLGGSQAVQGAGCKEKEWWSVQESLCGLESTCEQTHRCILERMLRETSPRTLGGLWLQQRGITECWEDVCACQELPALLEKCLKLKKVNFCFTDNEFHQEQVV